MSETSLVSIVMPAWKPRSDWLHDAVASALRQKDCEVEVIVVDDGSPVRVAELLADVKDARLRVIRVEHGGVAHSRNAGVHAARGEFLRFADADDALESGSTARLLRLAGDGDTIAYGATMVCDDQLRPLEVKSSQLEGWIAQECLLYRFEVRHMSMLFPRRVVEAVGEWEPTLRQCQDWDFVLRALEQAPARGEQGVATYYRRHGGSLSANVEAALRYETAVVDRYFERHPRQVGSKVEREARAKLLMVRAEASPALGVGRREQLGIVARAFKLHPKRAAEELSRAVWVLGRRAAGRMLGMARSFSRSRYSRHSQGAS